MAPLGAVPIGPQNGSSSYEVDAGRRIGLGDSSRATDSAHFPSKSGKILVNLIEPILRHACTQPSTVALLDEDRTVTYGELTELVLRTAGHLSALGVRRRDYVGLCLKDNWQHFVALLATARMGAIAVQIDPRARTAEKARIAAAFDFKL